RYLIPPSAYRLKNSIANTVLKRDVKLFVSELQMEPWSPIPIRILDEPTQRVLMNREIMLDTMAYVKRLPTDRVWLWGVEWWYWQKHQNNNSEPWDAAVEIFTN